MSKELVRWSCLCGKENLQEIEPKSVSTPLECSCGQTAEFRRPSLNPSIIEDSGRDGLIRVIYRGIEVFVPKDIPMSQVAEMVRQASEQEIQEIFDNVPDLYSDEEPEEEEDEYIALPPA